MSRQIYLKLSIKKYIILFKKKYEHIMMKLLGNYNEQMFHENIEMIENEIIHG